jgi:hypothetical protein
MRWILKMRLHGFSLGEFAVSKNYGASAQLHAQALDDVAPEREFFIEFFVGGLNVDKWMVTLFESLDRGWA